MGLYQVKIFQPVLSRSYRRVARESESSIWTPERWRQRQLWRINHVLCFHFIHDHGVHGHQNLQIEEVSLTLLALEALRGVEGRRRQRRTKFIRRRGRRREE